MARIQVLSRTLGLPFGWSYRSLGSDIFVVWIRKGKKVEIRQDIRGLSEKVIEGDE